MLDSIIKSLYNQLQIKLTKNKLWLLSHRSGKLHTYLLIDFSTNKREHIVRKEIRQHFRRCCP